MGAKYELPLALKRRLLKLMTEEEITDRISKHSEASRVYVEMELEGFELKEEEIDTYILHLQDILNFANIVNNAPVEGLDITIGANEAKNRFRKDEVKVFDNIEGLLQNAPEQDRHMFKIPKVLN